MTDKPRIGLILGDPGGIGAELIVRLLSQTEAPQLADILLIGDKKLLAAGEQIVGAQLPLKQVAETTRNGSSLAFYNYPTLTEDAIRFGVASAEGGKSVLKTLKFAVQLVQDNIIDAICFAPLNKQAMHLGGLAFDDELHYFADLLDYQGPICEINVLEDLWTTRVTSHIALKEVAQNITSDGIVTIIKMTHQALQKAGKNRPRIGVAALNPHAGDGGVFGREEIDIIEPAVRRAQELQIAADGPYPSDTIFLKAVDKQYDAVVTMYHDQGQIAMKLLGFERGVTVQGGLPIAITTPAHGTAYDIAGSGKANVEAIRQAFLIACNMAASRLTEQ